jgi:hypothetical protein
MARMMGAIFMKLSLAPATSIISIVYSVIALMGTCVDEWVRFFGFYGLFGPSEIGFACSSFHTPQGRSHFTPYAFATGQTG